MVKKSNNSSGAVYRSARTLYTVQYSGQTSHDLTPMLTPSLDVSCDDSLSNGDQMQWPQLMRHQGRRGDT
jgi:hypothetical protein